MVKNPQGFSNFVLECLSQRTLLAYFATNKFAYLNSIKSFINHHCLDLIFPVFTTATNSIENQKTSRMWEGPQQSLGPVMWLSLLLPFAS